MVQGVKGFCAYGYPVVSAPFVERHFLHPIAIILLSKISGPYIYESSFELSTLFYWSIYICLSWCILSLSWLLYLCNKYWNQVVYVLKNYFASSLFWSFWVFFSSIWIFKFNFYFLQKVLLKLWLVLC